jgi:predicted ABC-type ATPase
MTSKLRLLLFAGPNGSGKSTFTTPETLSGFGISLDKYINADDIAYQLSSELSEATQNEREWEAFYEARNRRQIYRQQKISFAFETVFSHPSTFLDIQACRQDGFEVIVIFVTTNNSAINVERVARRFKAGGHDVNPDKIVSRYARSMSFLPRIIEEADHTIVYDNSDSRARKFLFNKGYPFRFQVLPRFLDQQLTESLRNRRREKLIIRENFDNVRSPLLQESQFQGKIVWGETDYIVQSTIDGFIQHDLCLFSTEQQQSISHYLQGEVSQAIEIKYKDAAGSCVF